MTPLEKCKGDRDALDFIGLLTHAYLTWDPPITAGLDQFNKPDFTHFSGLNIQSLIIDNQDGEILALEKNGIHQHENPLIHAEQQALANATERLKTKRPRSSGTSVENWYRSQLFYLKGTSLDDFILKGASL